jgi:hypothetical protein
MISLTFMPLFIKQNDTSPSLTATLRGIGDLTGATVVFHMRPKNEKTPKVINGAVDITDVAEKIVRYDWVTGDTDTAGNFEAEFQVTYAGGRIETVPNNSYIDIKIIDDIASPEFVSTP